MNNDKKRAFGFRNQVEAYFERQAERILGESLAAASLTKHRELYGTASENAVRTFLHDHLPGRYGIGTGHVVSFSKNSDQIDVVIFDSRECFKIPITESSTLFSLEGVYAVVEVKSSPSKRSNTRSAIKKAVSNISSVKKIAVPFPFSMNSNVPAFNSLSDMALLKNKGSHFVSLMFPVGAIILIGTGSKFETILSNFREEQESIEHWHDRVDLLCVLDDKHFGLCGFDLALENDKIVRRFWKETCETPGQTLATFLYWLVHKMSFERIIERPIISNPKIQVEAVWPSVIAPVVNRIRVDAGESQMSWPWNNETRTFIENDEEE